MAICGARLRFGPTVIQGLRSKLDSENEGQRRKTLADSKTDGRAALHFEARIAPGHHTCSGGIGRFVPPIYSQVLGEMGSQVLCRGCSKPYLCDLGAGFCYAMRVLAEARQCRCSCISVRARPPGRNTMRVPALGWLVVGLLVSASFAQEQGTPQSIVRSCTYQDGNEISVRFSNAVPQGKKRDLQNGKVWSPGDVPMLLFTQVAVTAGNVELPVGAYSLYVIPERDKWTLIVNKNVTAGAAYEEKQDIVRVPMQVGSLPNPVTEPAVSLGHVSPKVCSLRVDYGKIGAWADAFVEK